MVIILVSAVPTQFVNAACSPYLGMASLNEIFKDRSNMAGDPDDFVEVKILNEAIEL